MATADDAEVEGLGDSGLVEALDTSVATVSATAAEVASVRGAKALSGLPIVEVDTKAVASTAEAAPDGSDLHPATLHIKHPPNAQRIRRVEAPQLWRALPNGRDALMSLRLPH